MPDLAVLVVAKTMEMNASMYVPLLPVDGQTPASAVFYEGQILNYTIQSGNGDRESGVAIYRVIGNQLQVIRVTSTFIASTQIMNTVNPQRLILIPPSTIYLNPASSSMPTETTLETKLQSSASGFGASMIAIQDANNLYITGNVEGALAEVMEKANAALNDSTVALNTVNSSNLVLSTIGSSAQGKGASLVSIYRPDSLIASSNVQDALREIATNVQGITNFGNGYALLSDLASSNPGKGADLIGNNNSASTLASTAHAKGASLIGIEDAGGYLVATTVEGALQEMAVNLGNNALGTMQNQLSSTAHGMGASMIGIEDASNLYTSTTVEAALEEVMNKVDLNVTNIQSNTNNIQANTTSIANLQSSAAGKGAVLIPINDAGGFYSTKNVEAALQQDGINIANNTTALSLKAPLNSPNFTGTPQIGGSNIWSMASLPNPMTYPDFYSDAFISGSIPSVPSNTLALTAGPWVAYITGARAYSASETYTYPASSDIYVDLTNTGTKTYSAVATGAAAPVLASNSMRIMKVATNGTTITAVTNLSSSIVANSANINFTGTTTAVTQTAGDNSTKLATTAFVVTSFAPLASAALTGEPTAPTAAVDTDTTQLATTAFVINQNYLKASTAGSTYAPIASPTFTGSPAAPTAARGDKSTTLATTAFVSQNVGLKRQTSITFNATSMNFDCSIADVADITLTASGSKIDFSNGSDGQIIMLRLTQDATGSRTVTWGTEVAFSTSLPQPTLSTGANKIDILRFVYNATAAKYQLISTILGF